MLVSRAEWAIARLWSSIVARLRADEHPLPGRRILPQLTPHGYPTSRRKVKKPIIAKGYVAMLRLVKECDRPEQVTAVDWFILHGPL